VSVAGPVLPAPFEAVGGREGVSRIVDRFYDLMDSSPAYRELRMLHADDLMPMRRSLSGFLTAWIGGPRDWFAAHPGKCMMSVHANVRINAATANQWVGAMAEALNDCGVESVLAARIGTAFAAMATSMARTG